MRGTGRLLRTFPQQQSCLLALHRGTLLCVRADEAAALVAQSPGEVAQWVEQGGIKELLLLSHRNRLSDLLLRSMARERVGRGQSIHNMMTGSLELHLLQWGIPSVPPLSLLLHLHFRLYLYKALCRFQQITL